MNMRLSDLNGSNSAYCDRLPEKLTLEGYRHWTAGFETGSVIPWEMTWTLYTELLGEEAGKKLITELSQFIRVLRHCAICPLRAFPFHSQQICREECLTLALISSLQNDDQELADQCLAAMACKSRCHIVEEAASNFANSLSDLGHTLLPVPISALQNIFEQSNKSSLH